MLRPKEIDIPSAVDATAAIGDALRKAYADLPNDPLPPKLRELVERLGEALSERA